MLNDIPISAMIPLERTKQGQKRGCNQNSQKKPPLLRTNKISVLPLIPMLKSLTNNYLLPKGSLCSTCGVDLYSIDYFHFISWLTPVFFPAWNWRPSFLQHLEPITKCWNEEQQHTHSSNKIGNDYLKQVGSGFQGKTHPASPDSRSGEHFGVPQTWYMSNS